MPGPGVPSEWQLSMNTELVEKTARPMKFQKQQCTNQKKIGDPVLCVRVQLPYTTCSVYSIFVKLFMTSYVISYLVSHITLYVYGSTFVLKYFRTKVRKYFLPSYESTFESTKVLSYNALGLQYVYSTERMKYFRTNERRHTYNYNYSIVRVGPTCTTPVSIGSNSGSTPYFRTKVRK